MSAASRGLRDVVERRVGDDPALDDEAGLLILASLDTDEESAAPDDPPITGGSYLASITVEGFRGIGEAATLSLDPGPGLTVVAGRNGSGKSSFAEAAELAVTGGNRRWDGARPAVWREGWRNLHHPDTARIAIEIVGDGPPVTVARSWGSGDPLDGGTWTRQVRGQRVETVRTPDPATVTYRPFLSYNELGSVIDGKPSELHDAVHRLLGLEDLSSAQRRLGAERKAADDRAKAGRDAKNRILDRLAAMDGDERAARALTILRALSPDLDELGSLVLGGDDDDAILARLRILAGLRLPTAEVLGSAVSELREARSALDAASSAQAQASAGLAKLLRGALEHHGVEGDGPCPVCRNGSLDSAWRTEAERRAEEAERGARDLDAAQHRVAMARAGLTALIVRPPDVLSADLPVATGEVVEAWERWHRALAADDVATAVERAADGLRPVLTAAITAAEAELSRRDEDWRPVATDLLALHSQLERITDEAPRLRALRRAEAWLKDAAWAIRDERMTPFAQRSQEVWRDLRQQSNVDLGPIRLEGSATRRRAAFDVTVDDVEGAALSVMSQGELHSLALSVFLPRATVDESPFRFVLIDDPVQAMDPAKVDGLARVLAAVARDRQVIVFSHDDRLAESVRRAQLPATIVEVVRSDRSRVELRACGDPVQRHLDDARALTRDGHVPDDLLGELVASYCRSGLEAAAHATFRRVRLREGDDRNDVERRLAEAHKLHQRLTLAVFGDESRGGDLYKRLGSATPRAVEVVKACKQGAHHGHQGDLRDLVSDTEKLCAWVGRQ